MNDADRMNGQNGIDGNNVINEKAVFSGDLPARTAAAGGIISLRKRAVLTPNLPALITASGILSWRDLMMEAARFQTFIREIPERTLIMTARADPDYLAAFVAAVHLGKIVLPCSPRECPVRLRELSEFVSGRILEPGHLAEILPPRDIAGEFQDTVSEYAPDTPVNCLMSSGSTGNPKLIVHTLKNHQTSAVNAVWALSLENGDRYALSLPLNHAGGQAVIFRAIQSGCAMTVPEKELALPDGIARYGITAISLVPTQLVRLIDAGNQDPKAAREKLRTLKWILAGGAPLAPETVREFRSLYPGVRLLVSYAMTETASLAFLGELRGTAADYSGIPLPGWSFRISNEVTGEQPGTGEVLIRGPSLTPGYLGAGGHIVPLPLRDGRFATGDLGTKTPTGLKILGRRDNMFISGGENIVPEGIERELLRIPGIREAVVAPLPDREWGSVIAAVVKTDSEMPGSPRSRGREFSPETREYFKKEAEKLLDRIRIPKIWLPWNPEWDQGMKIKRTLVAEYVKKSCRRKEKTGE